MVAFPGQLLDRGPKRKPISRSLTRAKKPAILVEICFVDSKADAELYRKHFDRICKAIADAIR